MDVRNLPGALVCGAQVQASCAGSNGWFIHPTEMCGHVITQSLITTVPRRSNARGDSY